MANFTFTDNTDKFINAMNDAIPSIMAGIGVHLEGEAKDELENSPRRVDTGRLKGSIVFATSSTHSDGTGATNKSRYWPHKVPAADPKDWLPKETPEEKTLYVGTNVKYAPYVYFGTVRMTPNRFLKNAFERNKGQIRTFLENGLRSVTAKLQGFS